MEETKKSNNVFLAVSILVAAFLIGASIVWGFSIRGGEANTEEEARPNNNPTADDDVILGDPDAPVTLIEFGDYQCPFCRKMFIEVEEKLREEYVVTKKVKMVYRDFPLDGVHPFARPAAEAAECARDQGKYWVYHDELFRRQDEIPSMDFVEVAGLLGLEKDGFKQCYQSGKYRQEVEKDFNDGIAAGVTGTPGTFVVQGSSSRLLTGALPYEVFKAAIDEALAGAGL